MRPRQCCDDLLRDAVCEELLLQVPAQILKREHCDRGLIGQRQATRGYLSSRRRVGAQLIDPYRPRNVFEFLLAGILKVDFELTADLSIGVVGDTDAAGLGDIFQPCSDVDTIAKDITLLDHDVADMNAHTKFDALERGYQLRGREGVT